MIKKKKRKEEVAQKNQKQEISAAEISSKQ